MRDIEPLVPLPIKSPAEGIIFDIIQISVFGPQYSSSGKESLVCKSGPPQSSNVIVVGIFVLQVTMPLRILEERKTSGLRGYMFVPICRKISQVPSDKKLIPTLSSRAEFALFLKHFHNQS